MSDPITVSVSPTTNVRAWQLVKVTFSGTISGGHCAGDSFSFQMPDHLRAQDGASYPLAAPDGSTVANMVVSGTTVTVTLTSYVETHNDVALGGWLNAQLDNAFAPGTTNTLTWTINGTVTNVDVTMGDCTNCSAMPTRLNKWGSYNSATGIITVTLSLPTTTQDNQTFTFTDTLTTPGQQFTCPVSAYTQIYRQVDPWGSPIGTINGPTPSVTSCSETAISGTVIIPTTGYATYLRFPVTATDPTQTSWSDTATITAPGINMTTTQAISSGFGGGGSGSGSTPTSSTVTVSPTTTTVTPTVTDTSSNTVVPITATASGSATAGASGTSAPATSATVSPISVSASTDATTDTTTDTDASTLPRTGPETTTTLGLATWLLTAGGALVLIARRRAGGRPERPAGGAHR